MRRWAELHLDVGQRELEEEMGVLAGLSTADGLFDVQLKGKDRQTDPGGASSSITGLKLFQRSDPSHLHMVSACLPPYFFRGWFMKLRETFIRWDNCCSCPTSLRYPAFFGRVFGPPVHVSLHRPS